MVSTNGIWYTYRHLIGEMPTTLQKFESWKPKFRWCPDLGAIFPQDIFPACEPEQCSILRNSDSSASSIETSPDKSYSSVKSKTRSKMPISDRVLRSAMKSGISNNSSRNVKITESLSNLNLNESTWSDLELWPFKTVLSHSLTFWPFLSLYIFYRGFVIKMYQLKSVANLKLK